MVTERIVRRRMRRRDLVLMGMLFLTTSITSCQKFYPPDMENSTSAHGERESHNNGHNCMDCHYSAGYGEGWFTAAGSIYGNYKDGYVHFYEDTTQTPIKTLQIDDLGNIYTTQELNFDNGLFVSVENADGHLEFMEEELFSGQCNLCHGTGIEERIRVE